MEQKETFFFFDTETTGLPKDYNIGPEVVENWPRIMQLAWQVYERDAEGNGVLLKSYCNFIKPDGWVVPSDPFWAEKGHTTEICMDKGVPIKEAIKEFAAERHLHPYSIGHNLAFDRLMVRSEMFRLSPERAKVLEFKAKRICTMTETTSFAKIPNKKGTGYKWPKLEELYRVLFNEEIPNSHFADADVAATARCFFECLKRGWITI